MVFAGSESQRQYGFAYRRGIYFHERDADLRRRNLVYENFSIGGGHICADLSEILGISYQMAEDLYGKVNLNLEFDPEEVYQLKNSQTANADQTNQIVKARIEDLARYIRKSMAGCPNTVNTKMPVFLTGGGLSNVKGGVEYLSTVLDKPVSVAHSVNPLTDKPQYASAFGVIDLVLNQNN